jgi:hypothetical protein
MNDDEIVIAYFEDYSRIFLEALRETVTSLSQDNWCLG